MKTDVKALMPTLRYFVLSAVMSVIALSIYIGELRLYEAVTGISFFGFDAPSLTLMGGSMSWWDIVVYKIRYLPGTVNSAHSLTLLRVPDELKWLNRAFLVLILCMATAVAADALLRAKSSGSLLLGIFERGRILFAAGAALFIAPFLIYFTFAPYLPPRSLGFLGFTYGAVFLLSLTLLTRLFDRQDRAEALQIAGMGALCFFGAVYLIVASVVWEDRKRFGDRDLELARSIYSRVISLPGYDGSRFLIYGGATHDQRIMWGSSLSRTVFRKYKPSEPDEIRMRIFQELYDLPWAADVVPESPKPCPAFPADGSVFMHDRTAYICLEASE